MIFLALSSIFNLNSIQLIFASIMYACVVHVFVFIELLSNAFLKVPSVVLKVINTTSFVRYYNDHIRYVIQT